MTQYNGVRVCPASPCDKTGNTISSIWFTRGSNVMSPISERRTYMYF